MARQTGPKVVALTTMNVGALALARDLGLIPAHVLVKATTATWPHGTAAAHAEQQIVDAIAKLKANGPEGKSHAHALHAVRRKLAALADIELERRGGKPPPPPIADPPSATMRLRATSCDHAQPEGTTTWNLGRTKCLCCGLIYPTPKPVRQRPARPGQGGVTTASVTQADPKPAAPQTAPQPSHVAVQADDGWLVVQLGAGDNGRGRIVASCNLPGDADRIAAALNAAA